VPRTVESIRGLMIGEAVMDPHGALRIVAIDPDLNTVEAEDAAGVLLFDTIDHFHATHSAAI
jgi:hypothetical protein